jgi:anti-sigma regulatory factor (Ser/Thr protein kinase)
MTGSPVVAAPLPAVRVLPGHVENVRAIRRWVGTLAAGAGCAAGDPELAVAELFTNAVRHSRSGAGGVVTVTVATAPGVVVVHVHDQGADDDKVPCVQAASFGEGGRGLALVAAVSVHWGTGPVAWCRQAPPDDPSVAAGGCCVWCHLGPAAACGAVSEAATCKVPRPRSAAGAGAAESGCHHVPAQPAGWTAAGGRDDPFPLLEEGSGAVSQLPGGHRKLPAERR